MLSHSSQDFFEKRHTEDAGKSKKFRGKAPGFKLPEDQELDFGDLEDLVKDLESKSKYSDIDLKFEKAFKKGGSKKSRKERGNEEEQEKEVENNAGEELDLG